MANWYKNAQEENKQSFEDFIKIRERSAELFGDKISDLEREKLRKIYDRKEVGRQVVSEPITINLYRNFDADINNFQKTQSGDYILSPSKSEQGVMWFAHDLQGSPERYYDRGAKYLLTYPLQIKKNSEIIRWSDGEQTSKPIIEEGLGLENSNKWGGYELPEGFFFSYKTEKHIICNKELIVSPSQIKDTSVFYHATYQPLLQKIKKEGLKPPVYLAIDKDQAESFAEVAMGTDGIEKDIPEEWLDNIVILEINKNDLDENYIETDPYYDAFSQEEQTFVYNQNISPNQIRIL